MVFFKPCVRSITGIHFRRFLALEMSGSLCLGSSEGSDFSIIEELLFVKSLIVSASPKMFMGSGFPRLIGF